MKIKEKTNEFMTLSTDGKTVMIYEFTEFFDVRVFKNLNERVEGLKSFKTADGRHVNFISEGEYKIVETGEILKRV
ncbi:MAG: hypothetical protein MUP34_02140 [Candidatus Atribacteria bacterium]|nr:hypothetical protein [Candidatus Atribacteria bacterium]